ncbi:MAG: glycoside hydrolase family 16 protein [Bacteroidia bacterium]
MKKIILIFVLFTISAITYAQSLYQVYPDKVVKWNYSFGDEFESDKLNLDKWNPGFPWARTLFTQDVIYLEDNIKLKNGNASFYIDKKDSLFKLASYEVDSNYLKQNKIPFNSQDLYRFKYTGGLIWSNQKFKYGYFEIKFKGPVGQGIWPAFWLYGGKPNYEIDFFELKGEKKKSLHVDVHCPDKCENFKEGPLGYKKGWGHWINTKQNLADSFNIVSGEWTKDYIKFYLNGELIAYYNHGFDIEMDLTIGNGVAKDGKAFKPGPNAKTPFPNEFCVDYVRVWTSETSLQKKSTAEKLDILPVATTKSISGNKTTSRKIKYFNAIKKKEKEMTTLSFLVLKNKKILVTVLGKTGETKTVSLRNAEAITLARTINLKEGENFIDASEFSSAIITFKVGGQEFSETINVE